MKLGHTTLSGMFAAAGVAAIASLGFASEALAADTVFTELAKKAWDTLVDLQALIYVIAGFGIIAFSFMAIFGKISFKHLGQIAFSLFLVSVFAPFISYFTGAAFVGYSDSQLEFADNMVGKQAGADEQGFADMNKLYKQAAEETKDYTGIGRAELEMFTAASSPKVSTSTPQSLKDTLNNVKQTVKGVSDTVAGAKSAAGAVGQGVKTATKGGNFLETVNNVANGYSQIAGGVSAGAAGVGRGVAGATSGAANLGGASKEEAAANNQAAYDAMNNNSALNGLKDWANSASNNKYNTNKNTGTVRETTSIINNIGK